MRRPSLTFVFCLCLFLAPPALAGAGDEAFLAAVKAGDVAAVAQCLDAGADPDTKDWAGWSALAWAALLLETEVAAQLIDAGADIEHLSKGGKNSGRPLMMAAKKYGGLETVTLLVARGADVNGTDQFGRTALWMAARYGRLETIDFLLANGADPTRVSRFGKTKTALAIARARGHEAAAARLMAAGATE